METGNPNQSPRKDSTHLTKKKKQKLKNKIKKNEYDRQKSTLQIYVDVFDKVGKGVDKFQKGVDKFEKGMRQLEDGTNPNNTKRKSNTSKRTIPKNPSKRKTRPKARSDDDDGFGWLGRI